jgi:hypothetical protein
VGFSWPVSFWVRRRSWSGDGQLESPERRRTPRLLEIVVEVAANAGREVADGLQLHGVVQPCGRFLLVGEVSREAKVLARRSLRGSDPPAFRVRRAAREQVEPETQLFRPIPPWSAFD